MKPNRTLSEIFWTSYLKAFVLTLLYFGIVGGIILCTVGNDYMTVHHIAAAIFWGSVLIFFSVAFILLVHLNLKSKRE
jgi:hypothetical protein